MLSYRVHKRKDKHGSKITSTNLWWRRLLRRLVTYFRYSVLYKCAYYYYYYVQFWFIWPPSIKDGRVSHNRISGDNCSRHLHRLEAWWLPNRQRQSELKTL